MNQAWTNGPSIGCHGSLPRATQLDTETTF